MSSRYFFGENADRPIRVGKNNHSFEVVGRTGGTAQGIIEVPADQADAFAAVAVPLGVTEITQEEYETALLKKKQNRHSPVFVEPVKPSPAVPLLGTGAVVVPGGSVKPVVPGEGLSPRVEDAVVVASAATAPSETPAQVAPVRKPRGGAAAGKKTAAASLAAVDETAPL